MFMSLSYTTPFPLYKTLLTEYIDNRTKGDIMANAIVQAAKAYRKQQNDKARANRGAHGCPWQAGWL